MKLKTNTLILFSILVFGLIARTYRLDEPKTYYFDEVYHAFTAKAYADNDSRGYEWWHSSPVEGTAYEWLHPPVSKLFMAGSIRILGDNSWGWRLPSALFGMMVIGAVYFLALSITKSEKAGLLAAGVASLDGLLLVQSRIAMNDVFVTFFMLMALRFYWRSLSEVKKNSARELLVAGMFAGLAVATKWSGVFVVGIIGGWEIARILFAAMKGFQSPDGGLITKTLNLRKAQKQRLGVLIVSLGIIPILIYLLSYGQFWLQGHSWEQFVNLHKQIWWYQTGLSATHPYQSRPWEWVLNLRPVWYHVSYSGERLGNIYALANPMVAWGGIVAMAWVIVAGIRRRQSELIFLTWAYLGVWVPWVLSPRIMFFYHYVPAVALMSVGWGILLAKMMAVGGARKGLAWIVVLAMIVVGGYFYPHWTGMEVSREWAESYYWFEEWR